ncbi:MAG: DUF4340 domain-containing protein [Candidatus Krumholzibacteriota bacterium]|nr:DUF4340 domain-containing protein [Candidatus Krumholzibacteriota bacterium]
MKMKREYIALVCVIAALVLYIALRSGDRTHYDLPALDAVAGDEITKIVITRADTSFAIERMDDRWLIRPGDYEADGATVDRMVEALGAFDLQALVSETGSYARYGFSPEETIGVEAWVGDRRVRSVGIGKGSTNTRHTFVRIEGDDGVYQAGGGMRATFDLSVDKLRNKTIATLDRESIDRIEVAGENGFTLMKVPVAAETDTAAAVTQMAPPGSAWRTLDGQEADEAAVGRLVGAVANLRADGFVYGAEAGDLSSPVYEMTVAAGERRVTLGILAKRDDGTHVVVASSSGHPFYVSEWRAGQLMKSLDDLLPEQAE